MSYFYRITVNQANQKYRVIKKPAHVTMSGLFNVTLQLTRPDYLAPGFI